MHVTKGVLNSLAVAVLCGLEDVGLDLAMVERRLRVRPVERLTVEHEHLIRHHRNELAALVQICDEGVQDRVVVFRAQLEADPTTVGPFLFRAGVTYRRYVCFSCGVGLPGPWFGRCWRCSLGWRLAYGLPVSAERALGFTTKREWWRDDVR